MLPKAEDQPTVPIWPTTAHAVGLSKGATYDAVRRGDIPSIRMGGRIVVPTAALRRLLGLDHANASEGHEVE